MKIAQILKCTKGELISGDLDREIAIDRFSTDSRSVKGGGLFIAIKGPRFNGNDFVGEAFRKGAIGAIVSDDVRCAMCDVRNKVIIRVADTTRAYGAIANYHRARFDIPVIAVTGSNGKTMTKEMAWRLLSSRFRVLKNEETKNNHIGVPETLFKLDKGIDLAILEFGINHPGEMQYLSQIAKPSMAIITNIGESHLEFLGSLEDVYKAKRELLEGLPKGAAAILNGDDRFLSRFRTRRLKVVTFGFGPHNDFRASEARLEGKVWKFLLNGRDAFELQIVGRHNIYNALAAIAAASSFGIGLDAIKRNLRAFKEASGMRLGVRRIAGIDFINDTYNSNPLSMRCAISALLDYKTNGRRFLISGDMLELGSRARSFHAIVGEAAAASSVDFLFAMGGLSKDTIRAALSGGMSKDNAVILKTHRNAALALRRLARRGDVVLVKGSRAMRMERVIDCFSKLS